MAVSWFDASDTLIDAPVALAGDAGVPSSATQIDLWNGRGGTGAQTLRNLRLRLLAYDDSSQPVDSGLDVLDRREIEVRIVEGLGQAIAATPWSAVGTGRAFELPMLPDDSGVRLELRVNAPAGSQTQAVRIAFRLESRAAEPLGLGLSESTPDGVLVGLGDGGSTGLLSGGTVSENPGGVDDQVLVGDSVWIVEGRPLAALDQLVQLDGDDGSAAALVAGESYKALLVLEASSTVTVIKGDKAVAPDSPALPVGGVLLAEVLREFDGLINAADIEDLGVPAGFAAEPAGLTVSLSPGAARVDGSLVSLDSSTSLSLAASSTHHAWLQGDGSFAITTDGSRPQSGALLLYVVETDASTPISIEDHRLFVGRRPVVIPLSIARAGGVQVGDEALAIWPHLRQGTLRPLSSVVMALGDSGAGTGGGTRVDVEFSDAGQAWQSIFDVADDRRPYLAFDAADPVTATAQPSVLALPGLCRLRASVAEVPTGGAAPASLVVYLLAEVL